MPRLSPAALGAGLAFSLGGCLVAGVQFGVAELSTGDVLRALVGRGSELNHDIVVGLRLPRVIMAALVGGGLAVSGASFQSLLRNPLAEPYILGVSGGAAFGAVGVLALGWAANDSWVLPGAAFAGAATALLLVFCVASAFRAVMDVRVLLLSGVVIAAFFGALVALVLSLSRADTVQAAVWWMMGSVASASWNNVIPVAGYTIPAVLALMIFARPMNLLAIGEETAYYLGARVEAVKRAVLLLAALIAASGVAFAGVIGFVGLVVPHAVRMVVGSDNQPLLPLVFLAGAAFLVLADLLARTVIAPTEIPIGVVTALVGVPAFLVLLRRTAAR